MPKNKGVIINCEFEPGDIVRVITDEEQIKRQVISLEIFGDGHVTYWTQESTHNTMAFEGYQLEPCFD